MKKILLIIAAFVIFLVTVLIYEKTSFDVISDVVLYCGTCTELPGTYRGGMSYCKP